MNETQINIDNQVPITWCPGCGNFSLMMALKNAIKNLHLPQESIVLVGDVGCSSKIANYVEVNTFGGLHGRAVPLAEGIKLANHSLKVIAYGGDGGLYAEGGNHILHAARRNINITLIVNDNQIYGLTKGQPSPTSEKKLVSGPTPDGLIENPFNPLFISLAAGATFVARGFAGNPKQLTEIFTEAINHKGFAIVDTLAPCVSFNKINTIEYYQGKVYDLASDNAYDKTNLTGALEKVREWEKIPTGILYKVEEPTYEDQVPILQKGPLVGQNLGNIDITNLFDS